MKKFRDSMVLLLAFCFSPGAFGQGAAMPKPGPEFDVLKADVGTWDVAIKAWAGPGAPTESKGKETSRMLGGSWLLVDFEGNMMGLDFTGHGIYGYDAAEKQYIGTWVDSLSPKKMEMVGKYDAANKTLTYEGIAPGPDGKPANHVMQTTYKGDGTRVMTMEMEAGGNKLKIFEMSYTKATR